MRYFPEPQDLTNEELKNLYLIKRADEWVAFLAIISQCRDRISHQIVDEALTGQATVVFRHIGALAFTEELHGFLEAAEEELKLRKN